MKRTILTVALAATIMALSVLRGGETAPLQPGVLAEVGPEKVTMTDLVAFVAISGDAKLLSEIFDKEALAREAQKLMREGLGHLVQRKVLLLMAWKKKGEIERELMQMAGEELTLPERTEGIPRFANSREGRLLVDRIVKKEEEAYGNRASFLKMLNKYGVTLRQVRASLAETLIVQVYFSKIETVDEYVSPAEIREYYEENREEFEDKRHYEAKRIFIPSTVASAEEAGNKAEEVKKKLAEGADFDKMIEEYSGGPKKDEGGLWKWKEGDKVPSDLENAANLEEGEVSEILATEGGLSVILMEKKEKKGAVEFKDAVSLISRAIVEERKRKRYNELLEQGRKEFPVRSAGF